MTQMLIVTGKKKDQYEEKGWVDNYFHNDYKYGPKTKSRNGYTWSNKMADDVLKYCTKCNLVWEYVQYKEKQVNYYEDFPTLGKERKECDKCKNQNP